MSSVVSSEPASEGLGRCSRISISGLALTGIGSVVVLAVNFSSSARMSGVTIAAG